MREGLLQIVLATKFSVQELAHDGRIMELKLTGLVSGFVYNNFFKL